MLLSTLSFTGLSFGVKYMQSFPTFELIFFRALGSFILASTLLLKNKEPMIGKSPRWLILRALCGLISMSLFFASLQYLPLGTAVSLRYVAPIFATFFAIFLLKEKVFKLQLLFIGLAFAGIAILKGFDDEMSEIGFLLIMACAFFSGFVYIIIRKIGTSEHPLVVVNYFMGISTLIGFIFSVGEWVWPQDGWQWGILVSLGLFGFLGQFYMTKAFQIGETNKMAPLKYMEGIFALIVGMLFLDETYTRYTLIGVGLVLIGLSMNTLYKPLSKGRPLR